MRRSRLRLARVVFAVALMTLQFSGATAAFAGSGSASASLSDTVVSGRTVHTVLTVPATSRNVVIARGSVTATLGGQPVQVAVAPVQQEQRAALLVVDTSGSMGPKGISAATDAARAYLRQAPPDVRVGLVTFSDTPHLVVPPTRDRKAVSRALPGLAAKGETALYDGLALALKELGSTGSRSMILLSDGGDTSSTMSLSSALTAIGRSDIRMEVVGFRTDESQNSVLSSVASHGGGRLLPAGDADALGNAFRAAARALVGQVRLSLDAPSSLTGRQPLIVRAVTGGTVVHARSTVALPQAAAPVSRPSTQTASPPAPALPVARVHSAGSPALLWGAVAAVFAGIAVIGWALVVPLFTPAARRRLQALDDYVGTGTRSAAKAASPSVLSGQVLQLSDKLIAGKTWTAQCALLLERADLPLRVNEWSVLRVVAVTVSVAAGWMLFGGSGAGAALGVLGGLGVGLLAPSMFLKVAAARRAKKFEAQLPDSLTLIASSLATGFSLAQAIDAVVMDAAQPTAKEFSRALAETRIGSDLEDSLDRLSRRMGSGNLEWTTMAIRIQRQVGGNLAETLRTTAGTLRERESLRRHVNGLSAEGRLSAYILIAMPIGLFFFMNMVNHDYLSLLWTQPLGWMMLCFAMVSLAIGIVWMRNVVKVEV
jgi:tight adherence protein B